MYCILALYILTLSMTSAFALSPVLPIPLLTAAVMLLLLIFRAFKATRLRLPVFTEDIFIFLFLVAVGISGLINGVNDLKNFNHIVSYVVVIFLYLFVARTALYNSQLDRSKLFLMIVLGVLGASFCGLIEFISKNILGFNIDPYLHHITVKEYFPTYMGFIRTRSFVEESGHFALYLNCFLPLVIYWALVKVSTQILKLILICIFIGAYITTFSAAGFISILISCFLIGSFIILSRLQNKHHPSMVLKVYVILIIAFCFLYIISPNFVVPIINKITFVNTSSAQDRLIRWEHAFQAWTESPLWGTGPGSTSIKYGTGVVNWYLQILSETGLITLLLFILFVLIIFKRIFLINNEIKYIYLLSFTACLIHYTAVSNYWYPWFWFLVVLIQFDYKYFRIEEPVQKVLKK